mmetsp:Transcript_42509/g.112158  ORF Transcript_42509/g.112158 Transcript_42509/m.112158 type:complete len:209 (-) Transcript_42509:1088-1714(-)
MWRGNQRRQLEVGGYPRSGGRLGTRRIPQHAGMRRRFVKSAPGIVFTREVLPAQRRTNKGPECPVTPRQRPRPSDSRCHARESVGRRSEPLSGTQSCRHSLRLFRSWQQRLRVSVLQFLDHVHQVLFSGSGSIHLKEEQLHRLLSKGINSVRRLQNILQGLEIRWCCFVSIILVLVQVPRQGVLLLIIRLLDDPYYSLLRKRARLHHR